MNTNQIIQWFKEYDYQTNQVTIRNNEFIPDINKTVSSLIYLIESREINEGYNAYVKTLELIYKQIK